MRYAPKHRKRSPLSKWVKPVGAAAIAAAFPMSTNTGPMPAVIAPTVSSNTPAKGMPAVVSDSTITKPVFEYKAQRRVAPPVRHPEAPAHHRRHHHHPVPVVTAATTTALPRATVAPTTATRVAATTYHPVTESATPSPTHSVAPSPSPAHSTSTPTFTPKPVASSSGAAAVVAFVKNQLGRPYVYGGTGLGGFDCSGLTQAAWAAAGVTIPRTSQAQYSGLRRVSSSSMQPGDILVFYSGASHVGIYIGGGYMIHAPHSGTVVQKVALAGYYTQNLIGVVRP